MDWLIEIIVTVIPAFLGDTIEVVVTAIPDFGTAGAVGIFGIVGFIIIFGMDYLINGGKI